MLPKPRGVFFDEKSACGRHTDQGVLQGIIRLMNIEKVIEIHAPCVVQGNTCQLSMI